MIFAWRSIVGGSEPNSDVGLRRIWKVSRKVANGFPATNSLSHRGSVTCAPTNPNYGAGGSHSFFSKNETIIRTFIVIDCSR